MGGSIFASSRSRFGPLSFIQAATSLVLLLSIPSRVVADDHGVIFLFPTRGLTFHHLDVVNVTYTSPFPTPNLYTFCGGDGGITQMNFQPAAPYNGSVLELLNFTSSTGCWFNLRPGTETGHGANSQSFQLLSDERSPTTVGLPLPSSTSSSSSSSTSSSTSSASPTGTAPAASTSDVANSGGGGLSNVASAGIGVGVALGVIAIAGVAAAFWWRRRKATKAAAGPAKTEYAPSDSANGASPGYSPSTTAGYATPAHAPEHHEEHKHFTVAQPYTTQPAKPPVELGDANLPAEMP